MISPSSIALSARRASTARIRGPGMNPRDDIEQRMNNLLLAYERLGAERRRTLRISTNEEVALMFIARGVTAPSELSRCIGMTTAGMTNLLDRLEQAGFLRREPHGTDKRRVLVTLTKKGFRAQLAIELVNEEISGLVQSHGPEGRALIGAFLAQAADAVDAFTRKLQDTRD